MLNTFSSLWPRFQLLPVWARILGWLFAWPLLVPLWLLSGPPARWRQVSAVASFAVLAFFWTAMCAGIVSGDSTSDADGGELALAAAPPTTGTTETTTETGTTSATEAEAASTPETTVAPTDTPIPTPTPAASTAQEDSESAWTVTRIIDGDTVEVESSEGSIETVRVVGIDTPERGECGYAEAADALARLVLDEEIGLTAGAQDDRDRYGRILRYIDVQGVDAGLELIRGGFAIARYDSRDGYGRHGREDAYVEADASATHICDEAAPPVTAPAPPPPPPPPPPPAATPTPTPAAPGVYYANCTEARAAGAAPLYRGDPGYRAAMDRDDDGVACE